MVQVKFTRAATKIYSYWNREVIYSQHLTSEKDPPQIIINTYILYTHTILLCPNRKFIEESIVVKEHAFTTLQTIHCIATMCSVYLYMYCKHISICICIDSMRNKTRPQLMRARASKETENEIERVWSRVARKKICFTI